jgi:hypothetical protein
MGSISVADENGYNNPVVRFSRELLLGVNNNNMNGRSRIV